ncbi:MAG: hypothetical protein WC004_03735 [Candidatus Absconditabacterales bacterium]
MNSILTGKNVCVVRDRHSDHADTIKNIISALRAAGAAPYLFDDIISGDRNQGFLNNINKADIFVICSETNLISSYIDGGAMASILNTIKGSGKYIYELPVSKFRNYQSAKFEGVLISDLVSGSGTTNTRIYSALENIIGDIQAKGGLSAQIATTMENDPTTLPGRLAAAAAAKKQQDTVRDAVANARITNAVAKVQEYVRKGRFEELAYRGIGIQANEGLDSLGGPQELERQLRFLFGDVKVNYDTGFGQDRHNDKPRTHILKVSGGVIEEGIQRLRETRVQHIVDEVSRLIDQVNIYASNGYMIPIGYELDGVAQRLCVTKFAALGISAKYDENTGMYREPGSDRPKTHYLRFEKLDIQAKLAEALANKLVEKISLSGNFDGPWTFFNEDVNGSNDAFSPELIAGAKRSMGNNIKIVQEQAFNTPRRWYLKISR